GIESPGLTAAPAFSEVLTEEITEYLMPEGPALKNEAVMTRKAPVRFRDLSLESQGKLIAEDPRFANVICRCENITEAEIVDAIRRTIGEVTVNGIKMRTRSGMGRCQGGFCLPRVLSIIARETAKPVTSVTLSGNASDIVTGRTR
ncbi:FAD/NAD(P)-binding oxidoreductase, partial [Candidatus Nomurabacteria bacterium]|nr:FAD/NAD(P)-binding oxidoreductase [Candidatus Nomurabacteria bacterium]